MTNVFDYACNNIRNLGVGKNFSFLFGDITFKMEL